MRNFLLSYSAKSLNIPEKSVLAFIKASRLIDEWSYLYDGAYLIKSSATLKQIDESFDDFFRPVRYVIAEIDATTDKSQGLLSDKIWNWLKVKPSDPKNDLAAE